MDCRGLRKGEVEDKVGEHCRALIGMVGDLGCS